MGNEQLSLEDAQLIEEPIRRTPEQVGRWLLNTFHRDGTSLLDDSIFAGSSREDALRSLELQFRRLPSHINPHDLKKTGWGAIFPKGKATERKALLSSLLTLRKKQAGKLFKTYLRPTWQSGEQFLSNRRQALGTIPPNRLPYYLLIVASPEEIPFEFQYYLSLSRAVGRIWFEDPHDFRRYAQAVRRAEAKDGVDLPRQATIFSVENDAATKKLARWLVRPLELSLRENFPTWKTTVQRQSQANKERLRCLLGGGETPSLLVMSCHGRQLGPRSPEQKKLQGTPVCQVPGADATELFTAQDLTHEPSDLHGLISFFFSCYSVGTPSLDNFPHAYDHLPPEAALASAPRLLSRRPFLAHLPMALLSRGALAVVGHVDRGWTTSFVWPSRQQGILNTYSLEDSLRLLLRGHRVGHALHPMNNRYLQLSARLSQLLNLQRIGSSPEPETLGLYWTAVHDARNLVLLGDPAVYLRGQREPEVTVPLDQELLKRLERRAGHDEVDLESWIYTWLKDHV